MADEDDSGEKPFEATPRKLEEARKRGEFPISQDLVTSFVYLGILLAFALFGAFSIDTGGTALRILFERPDVLAERVLKAADSTAEQRIDLMFRLVLARYPDALERRELLSVLESFEQRYLADPAAALQLVGVGQSQPVATLDSSQLAAYTLLANLILNLDEAVTRN